MVEESTSALLAPPGMGTVALARALVVGRSPEYWPRRKIMGATRTGVYAAVAPPHSGPQLRMYAVPPSAEKTALMG